MKTRTVGIAGTLIFHLAVLSIVLGTIATQRQMPPNTENIAEVTLLNVGETITPLVKPNGTQNSSGPNCVSKTTYDGVGVTYVMLSGGAGLITKAPETLPGYVSGLRIGDIIENAPVVADNGYKTFHIARDFNQHLVFTIKTEKICYEEVKPTPKDKLNP